jgi:hypothetical protein
LRGRLGNRDAERERKDMEGRDAANTAAEEGWVLVGMDFVARAVGILGAMAAELRGGYGGQSRGCSGGGGVGDGRGGCDGGHGGRVEEVATSAMEMRAEVAAARGRRR